MSALRALLSGIVDYAGLFPPAALDMPAAVRNYADYLEDAGAWMLGRFVAPASRLREFSDALAGLTRAPSGTWRIAALIATDADVAAVRAFNEAHHGAATVDTLEAKVDTRDDVERIAALRQEFTVFAEVPLDRDVASLIAAIRHAGIHAKIRTGGVVAAAIPAPDQVVRFIRACVNEGVAFKATAGLHHPMRAEYRLTYDASAPTGVMLGYLNVFLAAAFMANGMSDADAVRVLEERDPASLVVGPDGIRWHAHFLTTHQLDDARRHVATSFGSCSFREPVDELRALAF